MALGSYIIFIFVSFIILSSAKSEVCTPVINPPVENTFYLNNIAFGITQSLPICRLNDFPEFLLKVNSKWGKDKCPFDISEGNHLVVSNSEYIKRRVKINSQYTMVTDGNAEVVFYKNKIQVINGKVEIYSNATGVKLLMVNTGRIKECEGPFIAEPTILGTRG